MVALFVTNWQDFQKIQLCGTIFVAIYNVRVYNALVCVCNAKTNNNGILIEIYEIHTKNL